MLYGNIPLFGVAVDHFRTVISGDLMPPTSLSYCHTAHLTQTVLFYTKIITFKAEWFIS